APRHYKTNSRAGGETSSMKNAVVSDETREMRLSCSRLADQVLAMLKADWSRVDARLGASLAAVTTIIWRGGTVAIPDTTRKIDPQVRPGLRSPKNIAT